MTDESIDAGRCSDRGGSRFIAGYERPAGLRGQERRLLPVGEWWGAAFRSAGYALARLATLYCALAVIFWRAPTTFTNPQFWAEDGVIFTAALTDGWASLGVTIAGYLMLAQSLTAVLASYFSPIFAPTIYNFTAVALTLQVVWLVTSPRLDLPAKPLLAIAVVIVPMGYEEIGTLCNIQWILPIGAFVMLFMRPSPSRVVLIGEAIFVGLTALSGPFSIFLAPLFLWRGLTTTGDDQRRLLLLSAIVSAAAVIQMILMATHKAHGIIPVPYDWTLWVNLPFRKIATNFGTANSLFQGAPGVVAGAVLLVAALALSLLGPYRLQKLFMLYFGSAIAVAGMMKFRDALGGQQDATRYFYVAAVFSLWFLCCLSIRFRYWSFGAVATAQVLLLQVIWDTPRNRADFEWKAWAAKISPGEDISIPIPPAGWFVTLRDQRR